MLYGLECDKMYIEDRTVDEREHTSEHVLQQELNKRMREFLENHWPHAAAMLNTLNGKVTGLFLILGASVALNVATLSIIVAYVAR